MESEEDDDNNDEGGMDMFVPLEDFNGVTDIYLAVTAFGYGEGGWPSRQIVLQEIRVQMNTPLGQLHDFLAMQFGLEEFVMYSLDPGVGHVLSRVYDSFRITADLMLLVLHTSETLGRAIMLRDEVVRALERRRANRSRSPRARNSTGCIVQEEGEERGRRDMDGSTIDNS